MWNGEPSSVPEIGRGVPGPGGAAAAMEGSDKVVAAAAPLASAAVPKNRRRLSARSQKCGWPARAGSNWPSNSARASRKRKGIDYVLRPRVVGTPNRAAQRYHVHPPLSITRSPDARNANRDDGMNFSAWNPRGARPLRARLVIQRQ